MHITLQFQGKRDLDTLNNASFLISWYLYVIKLQFFHVILCHRSADKEVLKTDFHGIEVKFKVDI